MIELGALVWRSPPPPLTPAAGYRAGEEVRLPPAVDDGLVEDVLDHAVRRPAARVLDLGEREDGETRLLLPTVTRDSPLPDWMGRINDVRR